MKNMRLVELKGIICRKPRSEQYPLMGLGHSREENKGKSKEGKAVLVLY
jgi:hypothetical protein